MCGINKVLKPTNTGIFPLSIGQKGKRRIVSGKQIQFYSDAIREMAKKSDLSMDDAVARIIEKDAMGILSSSYRRKCSVSEAARSLKAKLMTV